MAIVLHSFGHRIQKINQIIQLYREIPFPWPTKMLAQLLLKIRKCLGFATFPFSKCSVIPRNRTKIFELHNTKNHSATDVKNPQGEAVLLGGFYHVINQPCVDPMILAGLVLKSNDSWLKIKKSPCEGDKLKANKKRSAQRTSASQFISYTKIKFKTVFPRWKVFFENYGFGSAIVLLNISQ